MAFDPNQGMPPMPPGGPPQGGPMGPPPGGPPQGPPPGGPPQGGPPQGGPPQGPPPQSPPGMGAAAPPTKNLLQLWDELKSWPDDRLMQEMQSPTGMAPPYLITAMQDQRNQERERYQKQMAGQQKPPEQTVFEDVLNQAKSMEGPPQAPPSMGGPMPQEGIAQGMPPDMVPPGGPIAPPGSPMPGGPPPGGPMPGGPAPGGPMQAAAGGAYPVRRFSSGGFNLLQMTPEELIRLERERALGASGDASSFNAYKMTDEELIKRDREHGISRDEDGNITDYGTLYGEGPGLGETIRDAWARTGPQGPSEERGYLRSKADPHRKLDPVFDAVDTFRERHHNLPVEIVTGMAEDLVTAPTSEEKSALNQSLRESFSDRFNVPIDDGPGESPYVRGFEDDEWRSKLYEYGIFQRPDAVGTSLGTGNRRAGGAEIIEDAAASAANEQAIVESESTADQSADATGSDGAAGDSSPSSLSAGIGGIEGIRAQYDQLTGRGRGSSRLAQLYKKLEGLEKPDNTWKSTALLQMAAGMLDPKNATGNWFDDLASGFSAGAKAAAPTIMAGKEADQKLGLQAIRDQIELERMESADRRASEQNVTSLARQYLGDTAAMKRTEYSTDARGKMQAASDRSRTENLRERLKNDLLLSDEKWAFYAERDESRIVQENKEKNKEMAMEQAEAAMGSPQVMKWLQDNPELAPDKLEQLYKRYLEIIVNAEGGPTTPKKGRTAKGQLIDGV